LVLSVRAIVRQSCGPVRVLLTIIEREPNAVRRALAATCR
jgi:hypothetical protein